MAIRGTTDVVNIGNIFNLLNFIFFNEQYWRVNFVCIAINLMEQFSGYICLLCCAIDATAPPGGQLSRL